MAIKIVVSSALVACLFVMAGCGVDGYSPAPDSEECGDDCENGGNPDNGGGSTNNGGGNTATGGSTATGAPKYWIPSGERTAIAQKKPWSSWWYPLWQDTMFQGENGEMSPLEKYDAYNAKADAGRHRTTAAAYERTKIYDPRAASWAGLCDAWALAAILEPEPTRSVRREDITFNVGDQKALLLKTYEKVPPLKLVGNRFDGEWDDVYEDVLPNDLHRVIEEELITKRRAFIIDEDAGPEVWNEPVWKTIVRVEHDPDNPNLAHVHAWLFLASPHVDDRDYVGTIEDSREYTYDLEGVWKDEQFGVTAGKWTDRSQWDHPDYAIAVPDKVNRGSYNPQIHPEIIDRILGR